MSLVDEDLLKVEEPPVFRRTASDPPPDSSAGMLGSDEGSFQVEDRTAEDAIRIIEQDHQHSTPDVQQRLFSGIKNPSLARLGQEVSPYTPVDLNAYLMSETHSTPTPSRVSPLGGSHHLLPPLSAGSSSRSHSPAHSNQSLSPLPTLSELRNLQRANSAAGRLMAMKKLMGQTPPSPTSLRRAGSLNVGSRAQLLGRNTAGVQDDTGGDDEDEDRSIEVVNREDDNGDHNRDAGDEDLAQELNDFGAGMLGSPTKQTGAKRNPNRNRRLGSMDLLTRHQPEELQGATDVESFSQTNIFPQEVTPPSTATRPRLGRSNTVGTGGGEERRSVIGRRMMERLGTRVARQDEGGTLGVPAGLQGLAQRAKERKEREMLRLKAEAEMLARQQAEEESMDEAGFNAETGIASNENTPSETDQPRFSDDDGEQGAVNATGPTPLEDPQRAADTASVGEHRLALPIIVENAVDEPEAKRSPEQESEARHSIYTGRQSIEGGLSSDSDHRRGSVAFLETSGSEDSHQRYRQHSPYFGIGQGMSATGGHSHNLFAASDGLARSVSARSGASDTFEYAAHLRRSGSERRTTRGSTATPVPDHGDTVGDQTLQPILTSDDSGMGEDSIEEIQSPVETPMIETPPLGIPSGMRTSSDDRIPSEKSHVSPARSLHGADDYIGEHDSLLPPLAPFASQHNGPYRDSTASQSGGKHSTTPSESSVGSSFSAIPFFVSNGAESNLNRTPRLPADLTPIARRDMSMSSFPAGIHGDDDRSSGFGTPGRTYGTSMDSPSNTLTTTVDSPSSAYTAGPETPKIARKQPSSEGSNINTHRRLGSAFEPRRMDSEVEELDEIASPAGHSIMSWQDVGDQRNSPIPSESYPRRAHGVVQTIKSTFKRNRSRSNSRSGDMLSPSAGPGTPTRSSQGSLASLHPIDGTTGPSQRDSRRGSQKSDASSLVATGPHVSLQSSILSHGPSVVLPVGQVSPLPQIDPNDPRALNSKLSPFVPQPFHAPLLQQASDSVVPTMTSSTSSPPLSQSSSRASHGQLDTSPSSAQASYYDLSAASKESIGAGSDEKSIGKKSWLAETFFTPHATTKRRPSISNILRRKGSVSQTSSRKNSADQGDMESMVPAATPPPLADSRAVHGVVLGPPLGYPAQTALKSSPTVKIPQLPSTLSAVEELATPISSHARGSSIASVSGAGLANKRESRPLSVAAPLTEDPRQSSSRSNDLLQRIDAVLTMTPETRPDILDDPPRTLVASVPSLQVVNSQLTLERHLFLFNDILVVTEPYATDAERDLGLDGDFAVKSVIPLADTVVEYCSTGTNQSNSDENLIIKDFRAQFSIGPDRAVDRLSEQTRIAQDSVTLAGILFRSRGFDKEQLADFLAQPKRRNLLDEYIRQFHFGGIRIDQAFRVYVLALYLPKDPVCFERILEAFARGWYQANISSINFGLDIIRNLVLAMMRLHDGFHPEVTFGFTDVAQAESCDEFIAAFYGRDAQAKSISEDFLKEVYDSIRRDKFVQAMSTLEVRRWGRLVELPSCTLDMKLPVNTWSHPIRITLPKEDRHFAVKLMGEGLVFEPDLLWFGDSRQQSFRVQGATPGRLKWLFGRYGNNAALYPDLPNGLSIKIEPAHMAYGLLVSFTNAAGHKRRQRYSMPDENSAKTLMQSIKTSSAKAKASHNQTSLEAEGYTRTDENALPPKLMHAARNLSLKVLRDSLMSERTATHESELDLPEGDSTPKASKPLGVWTMSSAQARYDAKEAFIPALTSPYAQSTPIKHPRTAREDGLHGQQERPANKVLTGKDLVLICRQNSLIPVVLGLAVDMQDPTVENKKHETEHLLNDTTSSHE